MAVRTWLRSKLWRAAAAQADRATDRNPGGGPDPPRGSKAGACGFRRCRRWCAGVRIAWQGDSLMGVPWQGGDRVEKRGEIQKILGGPGKSGMGIVYVVYDHEFREALAAKTFQEEAFAKNPGT